MNLPSIFKSTPAMKPNSQPNKNDKIDSVPQDMFGLGIQVFKIESKKQIKSNAASVGKARQEIKAIQNPRRTSNIPAIPKPKKTSAILPSITKTPSQKEYRLQAITKTDSILGRKSVEKTHVPASKIEAIQQYNQHRNNVTNPQKNKTFTSARTGNKSMDAVQQQQPLQPPTKCLIKQEWRDSLNVLRRFLTESSQFRYNEQSKPGRRKNQDFLAEDASFVEAYVRENGHNFYENSNLYDPFDIENYRQTGNSWSFVGQNYQESLPI